MKSNSPNLKLPERTAHADKFYGILGRALVISADFERNCKQLAAVVGIEFWAEESGSKEDLESLGNRMQNKKLYDAIEATGTALEAGNGVDALHEAREARNRLAHESSWTEPLLHGDAQDAENLIDWIVDIAERIIDGNHRALSTLAALSVGTDALPDSTWQEMVSYGERAKAWVMDPRV